MVKKKRTWLERFTEWMTNWVFPTKNLTAIIKEEDEDDDVAVRQAETVIVNHQYLRHMAKARIEARKQWGALQQQQRQLQEVPNDT